MTLLRRFQAECRAYLGYVREFSPGARFFLAAVTLGGITTGVQTVLLNLYVLAVGHDEAFLGRLLSLGHLAALPAAVLAGPLIDSWGTKRAMLAGTAVVGLGAITFLASPNAHVLQLGLALTSAGGVVVYVAAPPFLARHSTPGERRHLFAVMAALYVISSAAGSALGGHLPGLIAALSSGTIAPAGHPAQTYRASLLVGALLSGLGVPLLVLVHEPRATAAQSPAEAERRLAWQVAWRRRLHTFSESARIVALDPIVRRVVLQFIAADALIRLGGNLIVPFFNVFFVKHLGASEAWYGNLRSAERIIEAGAMLLAAPVALRYGPVATIAVTQVLSVPMLMAVGFAPTLTFASAAYLFRGTFMEMTVPTRDNFMMDVVPERTRATASAALLLSGEFIAFFANRIAGRLIDLGRWGTIFSATAVLYVISAALYWRFFAGRSRPPARSVIDVAALADA